MKRLVFAFLLPLLLLASCEVPTDTTTNETGTARFVVSPNFTFGNDTTGYAGPQKIWLAGTFNNWKPNDPDYQMSLNDQGNYEKIWKVKSGTVLKYKLIVKTAKSAPYSASHPVDGDWLTNMQNAYPAFPAIVLSPDRQGVTFETDGYGGYNAVWKVK